MNYNQYAFTVPKEQMIRVITNTDAKNEGDDQYAIVHTLLSPRFDNRGFIAAHFGDAKTKTSMEDSYKEIETIFDLMSIPKNGLIFRGATHSLKDETTPVPSEGAELIIREALSDDPRPLFVTFLGPLTDMASALLMEPRIADKLTVIWIGGGAYPNGGPEYNLHNDIHAANLVFKSKVPVWQVPRDVYQQVIVSIAELEHRVRPHREIGKYLFDQLVEYGQSVHAIRSSYRTGECWCLGDSPVVGLLLFEHAYHYDLVPAPQFTDDYKYIESPDNRPIRVYKHIDSRFIMEDFYAKLALFAEKRK
ncbi:nucleoside hydrolase [Paenibacillus piri]|uniref:Nucleoside hydrolase n=1 Tax=Paenibacillus piri TaxID=2547395 RepID=A0A4R5KUC7_9BACL|nr:nucleoside hydrolase [Paenibacillus piri]TDF99501.1 nucleoside hydrolase [Paenibacillus piri]